MKLRVLERQKDEKQSEYDNIHKQHLVLKRRVELLRGTNLHQDMLNEQTRRVLGYVDKDDIVLLMN